MAILIVGEQNKQSHLRLFLTKIISSPMKPILSKFSISEQTNACTLTKRPKMKVVGESILYILHNDSSTTGCLSGVSAQIELLLLEITMLRILLAAQVRSLVPQFTVFEL